MPEIDPVILQLRADVAKYNAEMQQTARRVTAHLNLQERSVVSLENQFQRSTAGIAASAGTVSRSLSGAGRALAGFISAAGALRAAQGFLALADQAKTLDAQLRLATQSSGSFAKAQDDVRRIANDSRAGIAETADLYGTFMRNARELGITQEQAARSTETITKAFAISGASAAEAAGGLRQFLQGIQSGTLRGEELNSVLENAPRLARALADGLGITIGQLREMGQEGELTGQKVINALESAATSIDAEFNKLPVTFDQAMTQVYNSAVLTFGAFDQGGEFSTALANFITQGSDGFTDLESDARDMGIDIRSTLAGLSDAFGPFLSGAMEAFGIIGQEAKSLADSIRPLLGEIDAISGWIGKQGLAGRLLTGGSVSDWWNGRPTRGTTLLRDFNQGQQQSENSLRRRAGERTFQPTVQRRDVMGNLINAGPTPGAAASSGGRKTTGGGRTPRSPLNPEAFAREEAQLNDQIQRLKADEVTNADERAMAELKRLEAANLAATTEVQGDKRYTDAQKAKIIALMGTANALQQAKVLAERDVIATHDALDARMSALRDDEDLLRIQANLASGRAERRDIELRLLDIAYQQERADLEALRDSKDASARQKQAAERRLAILGALQAGEAEGINRRNESPLARYQRDINEIGANRNDEYESIAVDGLQSLNDGLTDAIMNAENFGDVFSNVAKQVIADLIRMAIQQTIVNNLIGGIGGLLGGGGGMLGGGGGGLKSIANGKGFSSGGYTGDGNPNEPAGIVHKGEYVIPANAVKRLGVQNLAALASGSAAAAMTGVAAASPVSVQQNGTIRVALMMDNDVFTARVQEASVPVAVEVVRQSAPGMVATAKAETIRDLGRSRM